VGGGGEAAATAAISGPPAAGVTAARETEPVAETTPSPGQAGTGESETRLGPDPGQSTVGEPGRPRRVPTAVLLALLALIVVGGTLGGIFATMGGGNGHPPATTPTTQPAVVALGDRAAAGRIALGLSEMPGGWVLWTNTAVPDGRGVFSSASSWVGDPPAHPSCGFAVRLLDGTAVAVPDATATSGFQLVNGGFAEARDDVKVYPSVSDVNMQVGQLSRLDKGRMRLCMDYLLEKSASVGLPAHSSVRIRVRSARVPGLSPRQRGAEVRVAGQVRVDSRTIPLRGTLVAVTEHRTVVSYFSLSLFDNRQAALDSSLIKTLISHLARFAR
ncbi:MAG: hypothetical protein ACRDWW_04565, partial [Acidimicrobiales bacterium]